MEDPLQESDPWCVQNAKGRVRPEGPSARTLQCFLPPGLSSIGPAEPPDTKPVEPPPKPVEPPRSQALSRKELEEGLDLIQDLLDEQMSESEKRENALKLAEAARVPWLRDRRQNRNDVPRHMNRFSIGKWCDCSDGSSCSPDRDNLGF